MANLGNLSHALVKSVFAAAAVVAVLGGSAYIVSAGTQASQAGFRGYQIVTQTISVTQNAAPAGAASVNCPSGKSVLGGGVQMADNAITYASFPSANTAAWNVVVYKIAGTQQMISPNPIVAYAICAVVSF